jgi:fatty acid-binding protein DegV
VVVSRERQRPVRNNDAGPGVSGEHGAQRARFWLDGLARSGRLPGLAVAAARSTGLQFMFTLDGGVIRPIRPATSPAAAVERMIDMCAATGSPDAVVDVIALGEAALLRPRLVAAAAERRLPIGRALAADFGTAISLYTGPEVTGLAWRWRTPTAW